MLSGDDTEHGALTCLELVGSTAQLREDSRVRIWHAVDRLDTALCD